MSREPPEFGAYARATVTVEITHLGRWGKECSLEQIHHQAAESAIGRIRNLLDKDNTAKATIRIIGEPKILAITSLKTEESA